MKRITKYLTLLLTGSLAALTACGPEQSEVDVQHTPAINSTTLSPMTDESGSVRAYIGTEISAEGFNLDLVSHVTVDGVEAEITEQTIKTLKFKIPALDLAQQDATYQVWIDVYDADGESVIFHYPYYLTVPVTDALITAYAPAEGTVGTEVTLTGRNLEQITRVHFGEVTVEAAGFAEVTAEAIKVAVPAGEYAAGDSELAITAEWGTATIDVTGETLFTLHTPKFDAASQEEGTQNVLGDEVTFTGQNLDLVSGMKWGEYDLIVMTAEAGSVTVKFPSSIELADPAVAEAALTAQWGTPAQTTTVASAWRVDTTPVGPAKPELISMTAQDGGEENKFYLGKTVTVSGMNLASIEGFTVDGVAAALVGEPTDVEAQFIVPDGVTFTEATEVSVKALYNGGNEVDFGTAKVYPFYYYPNITIGAQDETNRDKAFFVPDWGRVITTDEFAMYGDGAMLDPYISDETQSKANVLNKTVIETAEKYYSVPAYFFCTNSSQNVLSLISPSNSSTQIRNHRTSDNTQLPEGYGTPVVGFRNIEYTESSSGPATPSSAEVATAEKAHAGTLSSVSDLFPRLVSSGAPQFDNLGNLNNRFKVGQVLLVQYMSYDSGSFSSLDDVRRGGLLIVKSITDVTDATASKTSTITFDFYWSKPLNE